MLIQVLYRLITFTIPVQCGILGRLYSYCERWLQIEWKSGIFINIANYFTSFDFCKSDSMKQPNENSFDIEKICFVLLLLNKPCSIVFANLLAQDLVMFYLTPLWINEKTFKLRILVQAKLIRKKRVDTMHFK